MIVTFRTDYVWIHVDHERQLVTTVFPDKAEAVGAPEGTRADEARCRDLGYADCWERCWVHELVHSWLADQRGQRWSTTLRAVAEGVHRELAGEINKEEAAVEAIEAIRHLIPDLQHFLANPEMVAA